MTRPTVAPFVSDAIQVVNVDHEDQYAVLVDGVQLSRITDPADTFCVGTQWTEPDAVPAHIVDAVRVAYGISQ